MTEEKTVRVKRKPKRGMYTYVREDGTKQVFKGGDIWDDCPVDLADGFSSDRWEFLDQKEEVAHSGRSTRGKVAAPAPPLTAVLSAVPCPDQEGMFDVINDTTDKRINDDPLTEDEANQLIADTNKEVE